MRWLKIITRYVFGALFVAAGANHFRNPGFYVSIMPPYLPWHLELVYISGVTEIALGVLLMIPQTSTVAAWGLIALLIAVVPANAHMALHTDDYPRFSPALIYARLPLQVILIAWAYWYTRKEIERS